MALGPSFLFISSKILWLKLLSYQPVLGQCSLSIQLQIQIITWLKLTANAIITKNCTNFYHSVNYQVYIVKHKSILVRIRLGVDVSFWENLSRYKMNDPKRDIKLFTFLLTSSITDILLSSSLRYF